MNKVTIDIPRKEDGKWGSYISKYPADSGKVPANAMTADTRNVITSATGQAEKRLGGAIWNANSLLSAGALDQYEGIFEGGTRLLIVNDAGTLKASAGNGMFASITAGFTNPANFEFATYQNRVYGCNGVDAAIVMDTVTSYGGASYVFTTAKTKVMGAQAPGSAPTAATVVDSTANQVPAGSHRYKVTFVYYNGTEESNGGAASAVCVNDATHTSNSLTAIPVGGYGVTARNIYRDDNDDDFRLLATISNNTATTYTDILPVGSTPTPIPTENNVPGIFKYIALYLDRLFTIDITGKEISWSVAGQPDVFLPNNSISGPQDDVMTAIYVFNGIPYVFGQHTVGTIQGTTDGTFYYSPISTTVGCVDNRTIQTRSIVSVPTLLWLAATPNKGIYYTNGSIVQYLSDYIEDLTFNLAQISYLERSNTQSSQAAFQGGTASPAIDLLSNPGAIQTINPKSEYRLAADWAAGVLSNISQIGDTIAVPTRFVPTLAAGTLGGSAQISGSNLTLPVATNFTGESHVNDSVLGGGGFVQNAAHTQTCTAGAQRITPPASGNLTGYSFKVTQNIGATVNYTITIAPGTSSPGSSIYSAVIPVSNPGPSTQVTQVITGLSVALTGGTSYFITITSANPGVGDFIVSTQSFTYGSTALFLIGGLWQAGFHTTGPQANELLLSYTFSQTAASDSGTWISATYDTDSTSISSGMAFALAATYGSGCSASILIQGSNDGSSWTTTDTLSSPATGSAGITGGNYTFWRLNITLSTTDNRNTILLGSFILTYATTGTWTSAAIECTTDVTTLDALTANTLIPASTTVTLTIATSADNVSYSAYTAIGLATPAKWAKIRITITTTADNSTSATVVESELNWTVVANLISSAIDTAVTPAGWGIFQFNKVGTSGAVTFYFRSAASAPGLSAAVWSAVTNGGYPTASALQFCQWKAEMTAEADDIPVVDSVTVNWLLTSGNNVRAASLFFNKSYYLAVATQGSTVNNLLIELDYEGNWRVHSGVGIKTMGLYFNDAFYAEASSGKVLNAFKLPTDNGTNIMFDLRTKCFDLGDNQRLKSVRSCKVVGVNTGTTIHVYYSVDRGASWIEMLNSSGVVGYQTSVDESQFVEYFIPNYDGSEPTSGRNIMFRVVSSDAFPCQILQVSPTLYAHKGKAITEAMA